MALRVIQCVSGFRSDVVMSVKVQLQTEVHDREGSGQHLSRLSAMPLPSVPAVIFAWVNVAGMHAYILADRHTHRCIPTYIPTCLPTHLLTYMQA